MTNQELVEKLISDKTLITPRIINAFKAIDRKDFVLAEYQEHAYEDRPLPIGYGATISQPTTVAFMLEKLAPQAGHKILEIGTGSGYMTALLAKIVEDPLTSSGQVFSIEYVPELKEFAENNLRKYNFYAKGGSAAGGKNISLFTGDGKKGLKDYAPFDRIISSASGDQIPKSWKNQIKIGGKITTPLGDNIILVDKISKRKYKEEKYPGFIFVPLR